MASPTDEDRRERQRSPDRSLQRKFLPLRRIPTPPPDHDRAASAADLIDYAQVTAAWSSDEVEGDDGMWETPSMEIRDTAVHRAFQDPKSRDLDGRKIPWRLYGTCTTPVVIPAKDAEVGKVYTDAEKHVRCRNCPGCIRARRHLWRLRAECEFFKHRRNWFFTGTFAHQTDDLDVVGKECQDWLKRVRWHANRGLLLSCETPIAGFTASGRAKKVRCFSCSACQRMALQKINYVLAFEPHKTGMLHMHALVSSNGRLRYRDLARTWRAGWEKTKLANPRSPGYVTKYVTKELGEGSRRIRPRVRSSQGYGAEIMARTPEEVAALLALREEKTTGEIWQMNLDQIVREFQHSQQRTATTILAASLQQQQRR